MAQTASALLRRPDDLDAMRADWETVDFGAIIDQGRWVCDCDTNEIGQICKLRTNDYIELTKQTII